MNPNTKGRCEYLTRARTNLKLNYMTLYLLSETQPVVTADVKFVEEAASFSCPRREMQDRTVPYSDFT